MGFVMTVKEWFRDELKEKMMGYHCLPESEYIEDPKFGSIADDTKLRIAELVAETEKAVKVVVEAETFGGHYKGWTTWIPKSVIVAGL